MPALSDYVTGTISLTNGSVDFTGTSTGWLLAGFKEGDTIIDITGATEFMGVIATIDANGAGTLTKAWEGPTLVDVAYRIRYQPDGARVSAQARNLIELLGNGNLQAVAGLSGSANQVVMFTGPGTMTTVPKAELVSGANYDVQVADIAARAAYDGQAAGYAVLVADTGDGRAAIYSKNTATSADWSDPAYVTGPIGPSPVFTVDATTTLAPGADATFALTPTVDGYEIDIGIPAGRGLTPLGDYSPATAYVLDDAVLYNGSTFIALQATTGNAPPTLPTTSNAYWQLLARQGIDGAGTVNSIVAGDGIEVDNTDPTAPVVSVTNAEPPEYDNLLASTSIMAIQISDNSNAALFMGDGVADAFDALTYVDVVGATNLSTATAGVLKPTIGSDTFASSGSLGLTSNLTSYGGYSTRERVPVGVITGDGDGIRLTLRPPTSGNNTPIDDVWVGHAGTGPNFDGTQVRVTFSGGSTGTTLTAGGSVVVSDLIPYAFDDSKDLIVAFDFGATADARGRTSLTGYNSYQKAATSGESGSTTVSGYTANADMVVVLDTIEVRTAVGTPNNMAVLSTSFTAPVIPDTMRAILLIKEVGGSSVAGTDYTFECSRDGGTTLDAMTLTEKYTLQNGITVVEADALDVTSQPSANNPRWRFDTLNNKNVELHGVHFLWPTGSSP